MFKYIHAADIHLDSPLHRLDAYEGVPIDRFRQATRRAFENLIQTAIEQQVSFVLIAGDLYDGDWKDYNTGLYLVSQLKHLNQAGIPVFILAGNHDAASRITKTLRFPENVRLFSASRPETFKLEDLRVAIHGQGFATPAVREDLSNNYPPAVPGYYNIGLLHTCATGRAGHENYAPCSLEGLASKGYDYWGLGHVHTYEVLAEDPLVVFSGNTQGRHVRETGPKGCVLVSVDGDGHTTQTFRPLDVVRWESIHMDARAMASGYDMLDDLAQRIETLIDANGGMPLALRIHIQGETKAHDEVLSDTERWVNELRSCAIDAGNGQVWVEKVKFDLGRIVSGTAPANPEGAMGELTGLYQELRSNEAWKELFLPELNDLQRKLPRELKLDVDDEPSGRSWLAGLLEQTQPMLVRRLLRKGGRRED